MDDTETSHIKEEYIQFIQNVDNWETAIQVAAKPLLEAKIIEPRYVQAMINNVAEMGDYMVLVPKVAMPHARPEQGAIGTGISILNIREAVLFGKSSYVNLLICLATKDSQSHLALLQQVSSLIDEESKVQQLINAKNKNEFLELLNKFSTEEETC